MNWEAIGAVGEVIGAFGVIGSLLYLAQQIRTGRNATLSATHFQVTESLNSIFFSITQDPELSRIFRIGNKDPSELPNGDFERYLTLVGGIFARYNNYFLQYDKGTLDEEPWQIALAHMKSLMELPGIQLWWKKHRHLYLSGLRAILDEFAKDQETRDSESRVDRNSNALG